MVNMTCPVAWEAPEDPKPFYRDGQLNFKAHDVGWIVCGVMALVATVSSIWLIWKHLTYYTQPSQQRHIVRLLIMVPIYAIVSFMSYLFYHEALYYQTIRDCYEAVLVTSFFYLLVSYTGDTRSEVHAVFRSLEVGKWVWPLGSWKYRPDGMHFLWIMKISVLQYAIVRPVCTLAAVGLEYFDLYCLASWMPWFGHVWCVTLISISVTVAMYCLIAFYYPIRHLVDPYKPILKFLAIKTIVFITFWQDTFLSFLVSFDVIKNTQYFSAEAIQVGINALLQCFWMMLFGFIHIKAFSYLPYRPADRARTTLRGRALLNVLDFRDWFWEMKDSTNYMRARRKGRNFTLAEDIRADRYAHLERALGRDRKAELEREMHLERSALKSYWKDPLDESHEGGGGGVVSSSSGTSGKGDAAPRGRRAGGGRGGGGGTRDMTDLEKLAAAVDEEDEADGLLSPSSPVPRSESAGRSLDYVARMYATDSDSHEDLYPELTMHHRSAPSIEIDHAASAAATDSGRGTRRKMDLSAVEEADEPFEPGRGGGAGGGAGVGAFGIAGWFGWNAYAQPVEQGETSRAQHADREKSLYLSADDGRSAAGAQPAPEASWWRSFRNRLSGSHSRGPSGNRDDEDDDDDDELEPLRAAAEAYGGGPGPGPGPTSATVHRLGQVAEGSWGSNRDLQGRYAAQQGDSMAAHSDAGSPTGPISPDVESPLSRLIQVHRDSLTTSERRLAQDALAASPSSERAVDDLAAAPIRRGPDASIPARQRCRSRS
ncbi:uncharacterized protein PFL1_02426 [Pseudozyma flocculosa PF-1]|uniref:uncharacterized protein n=1 Tax=Pseudozyma flocculosa PF-1 TaxID=1277687 RepID=UPI00045613EE|nr:uncharacterized protein PFL1_02426 [Pseudozyma flocculosa PF-1]EPQ30311.1 hypothetical protein PFL1_02426 [Pseudozyma flocculosa PF-1]